MAEAERQYECILFGATGYTGKYCAEHITSALPTDFRWAVAGRSESKLRQVVDELKKLNPDRKEPNIEVAQLQKDELVALARKTKVLVTTVGPYHKFGTQVVEACAESGTHYLDVTGETPWVYDVIKKYEAIAKRNGAILIPQNGIESAPTDLLVFSLVSHIRQTLGVGTKEVVQCTYDLKAAPSGGTLATVLTLFDSYSLSQFLQASKPWAFSPAGASQGRHQKSLVETLTGVRTVPDLGTLSDSLQGPADIPIVQRSWGLYDNGMLYGPKFYLTAYQRTRNFLQGFVLHLAMTFGLLSITLPPMRWLLKKFVYQPGQGPTREQVKHDYAEWRAIAHADVADPADPKRAYARMRWEGSMYALTGVTSAEAALILARSKCTAHEIGGGVLTPATLGAPYLERLRQAGLKTEVRTLP
ncbi:putative trans-acting enoyl reductase [Teratosphaeria destructans]|uniref:Trans-acting enoyl reductase n=1 Tax=Teratosphaeria destructans TaxID=418781 RepID=A0A9W7W077_9PEZI|nr:putative trans-acting enoyl reductase [Teratosphaeria destructans]